MVRIWNARAPRLAVAAVLVAAGVAVFLLPPGTVQGALEALRAPGLPGALLLLGAYVLGGVLFLPAPPIHLLAGFAFGPVWGSLLATAGASAGACAAFALGRWLFPGASARLQARFPLVAGTDAALATNGFRIVLLLRLAPFAPFAVLNYVLGATKVRLRDFALASLVGSVPGLLLDVYVGSLAGSASDLAAAGGLRGDGVLAIVVGAVVTGGVMVAIARLLRRALQPETAR
jgi:uncharacterized membrane protein YdjX (TVP38/TMEM64 family)